MFLAKTLQSHLMGGVAALSVALSFVSAAYAQKLSVLTWAGYELPEFFPDYTKEHPEGADITTFADDNDALSRVRSGFHPDIVHPCTFKLAEWKSEGLIQPLDPTRVKNWNDIYPALRKIPGVVDPDGKVWMIPWDWGNTSIVYRPDLVKEDTDTWNLLWNKKYAGRMAGLDSTEEVVVAGILQHIDPFNASSDDIEKIADKLRQQRPLMRFYSADPATVQNAMASGEIVAAMGWNVVANKLKEAGVPVAFMTPKEGKLTWSCGTVLMKDSKNVDKAYDFINDQLQAEPSSHLIAEYGYGSALKSAFAMFTSQQLKDKFLPEHPEETLEKTLMLRPMKNSNELMSTFEEVKEGG
ncbi:PotD/PotF family extracellular solute-binding protein [Acetobacter estunensis]|uniref:ABC transporter substrate-binding protein n=1 Tax=Acetobacter estunensis TaxID=104097 RepID=UPI001C2D19BD|nr:extracellular solute-binding protein [Acetobacter estunensis]MBV1837920.1 extracellular solute-binding protein [Acetobacter estunensis]